MHHAFYICTSYISFNCFIKIYQTMHAFLFHKMLMLNIAQLLFILLLNSFLWYISSHWTFKRYKWLLQPGNMYLKFKDVSCWFLEVTLKNQLKKWCAHLFIYLIYFYVTNTYFINVVCFVYVYEKLDVNNLWEDSFISLYIRIK